MGGRGKIKPLPSVGVFCFTLRIIIGWDKLYCLFLRTTKIFMSFG